MTEENTNLPEGNEEEIFNPSEPSAMEVDAGAEIPSPSPDEEAILPEKEVSKNPSLNSTHTIEKPIEDKEPAKDSKVSKRSFVDGVHVKYNEAGGLSLSDRAEYTKQQLEKEEKINTVIMLDPGERPGSYKVVNINGFRLSIRKNTPVMLPKTIWELIMRNQKASIDASSNHPRNLQNVPNDVREAL